MCISTICTLLAAFLLPSRICSEAAFAFGLAAHIYSLDYKRLVHIYVVSEYKIAATLHTVSRAALIRYDVFCSSGVKKEKVQ